MLLRVPAFMSFCEGVAKLLMAKANREMVATPEAWKTITDEMKANGTELPEVSYEWMKQFVESGEYSLEIDLGGANYLVSAMDEFFDPVLFHLSRRHWYLSVAESDAPDLICSDNPVSITPTHLSGPSGKQGLAIPGTLLIFPINRRILLVGSYEGITLPNPAPAKTIALANGATGRNAERFIFSPAPDFLWRDNKGNARHTADLLAWILARRGERVRRPMPDVPPPR